jgi:hypothetical protein
MRVRPFSRAFPVGILLGVLFASFYAVARPDHAWQILGAGAVTGTFISLGIHLLSSIFDERIERYSPRGRVIAKGAIYLVGGIVGGFWGCCSPRVCSAWDSPPRTCCAATLPSRWVSRARSQWASASRSTLSRKDGARGEAWLDAFLSHVRSAVDAGLDDDWTAVVLERTRT